MVKQWTDESIECLSVFIALCWFFFFNDFRDSLDALTDVSFCVDSVIPRTTIMSKNKPWATRDLKAILNNSVTEDALAIKISLLGCEGPIKWRKKTINTRQR